ncbi:protease complex subunit PrcB family protein [Pedobacter nutrimenti]|uniref:protease complex subunit PrcB family protein n=1 Tax=Pedobacter nutrimenti TaxID=1241337 RepID=UPI00292DA3AD|nr:protease complex subunit PrcB family protein [Pedobacter nutrimenti]
MNLYTTLTIPFLFFTFQGQAVPVKGAPVAYHQKVAATKVNFGHGVDLIVKGLGLNIDAIRFVKEPKATDYFVYANNKAVYAKSLIIAANNGIKLDRKVKLENPMTREQFATNLNEAIQATGNYPVNMMFIVIKDEAAFSKGSAAVQNLIKFNVLALEKGNFRPKAFITESEAVKMVQKAAEFVRAHKEKEDTSVREEVTMVSTAVNPDVNRITISRGTKPNSGYQIMINRIDFSAKGEAVVHYSLVNPTAGHSYLQVITEPRAETYISSFYKASLKKD